MASDDSGQAVIVDPGCYGSQEIDALTSYVSDKGLKVVKILLTHAHFDHVFGVSELVRRYDVPVCMDMKDMVILDNNGFFCDRFGLDTPDNSFAVPADKGGHLVGINDGDVIEWGNGRKWEVLATPGHTPGSVSLWSRDEKVIFTGDTLFSGSVGRTDLGGSLQDLLGSIRKLKELPPDTLVLPGHGPMTDIGTELSSNPYMR